MQPPALGSEFPHRTNGVAGLKRAIQSAPDDAANYYNLGVYLTVEVGDLVAALVQLTIADKLKPGDPATLLHRAQLYKKLERYDDAHRDLSALLEINPRHSLALRRLGALRHYHLNNSFGAIEAISKSLELEKNGLTRNISALTTLAAAEQSLGNFESAETYHKEISKSSKCTTKDLESYYKFMLNYRKKYNESIVIIQNMMEKLNKKSDICDHILYLVKFSSQNNIDSYYVKKIRDFANSFFDTLLSDKQALKTKGAILTLILIEVGRLTDASELVDQLLNNHGRRADLLIARAKSGEAALLAETCPASVKKEISNICQDIFDAVSMANKNDKIFVVENFKIRDLQKLYSHIEATSGLDIANNFLKDTVKALKEIEKDTLRKFIDVKDMDLLIFAVDKILPLFLPLTSTDIVAILQATIRHLPAALPNHKAVLLNKTYRLLEFEYDNDSDDIKKLSSIILDLLTHDIISSNKNSKIITKLHRRIEIYRSNIKGEKIAYKTNTSMSEFEKLYNAATIINNIQDTGIIADVAQLLSGHGFLIGARRLLEKRTELGIPPALLAPLAKATVISSDTSHHSIYARALTQMEHDTLSPAQKAGAKLALGQVEEALMSLQGDENPESQLAQIGLLLLSNNFAQANDIFESTARNVLISAIKTQDTSKIDRILKFSSRIQPLVYNESGKDVNGVDDLLKVVFTNFENHATSGNADGLISTYLNATRVLSMLGRHDEAAERLYRIQNLLETRPKQAIEAAQIMDVAYRKEAVFFCQSMATEFSRRSALFSPPELLQCFQIADIVNDGVLADRAIRQATDLITRSLAEGAAGQAGLVSLAGKLALISAEHHPLAYEWLAAGVGKFPFDAALRQHMASALRIVGDTSAAIDHLQAAADLQPWSPTPKLALAEGLRNSGIFEPATAALEAARTLSLHDAWMGLGQPSLVGMVASLDNKLSTLRFARETSALLLEVPAAELATSKGIAILSSYECPVTVAMAAVPALELRRQGYDVVHLSSGLLKTPHVGRPEVDNLSGIFHHAAIHVRGSNIHATSTAFEWRIDWNNRCVEALGMNFYQPIFERLNRWTRRYRFDVNIPSISRALRSIVIMIDRALVVCEKIRKEVAENNIPVRFVSGNWQYPPYAAFRIYCDHIGKNHDMEFVAIGPGYENYYSNLGGKLSNTLSAVNLTANPDTRAPFIAIKHEFDDWFHVAAQRGENFEEQAEQWIRADRAGISLLHPGAKQVLERIETHRAHNGKVACVFGKIVYDLTVPYTGGPAHVDMADFLNHTIESAREADTLVLIKPHPHELRYEIAGRPNEFFLDMIDGNVPANVVLLDHRWFNIRDLLPVLDLGVLWNGTTSLELGASGIPVVMCDDWGMKDYPVGHNAPRDRDHYAQIIKDPSIIPPPSRDYRARCAALLKYMSTGNVMKRYPYARRAVTNVHVGPPTWVDSEIRRYLAEGDPDIRALADRFEFRLRASN